MNNNIEYSSHIRQAVFCLCQTRMGQTLLAGLVSEMMGLPSVSCVPRERRASN